MRHAPTQWQETLAHRLIQRIYRDFDAGNIEFDEIEAKIEIAKREAYGLEGEERLGEVTLSILHEIRERSWRGA